VPEPASAAFAQALVLSGKPCRCSVFVRVDVARSIVFGRRPVTVFWVSSLYSMSLPEGSKVTLTVTGEDPLDITDLLLDVLAVGEAAAPLASGGVGFAVLDLPRGARFYRAGRRVSSGLVAELVARGLVEALGRAALSSSRVPQG